MHRGTLFGIAIGVLAALAIGALLLILTPHKRSTTQQGDLSPGSAQKDFTDSLAYTAGSTTQAGETSVSLPGKQSVRVRVVDSLERPIEGIRVVSTAGKEGSVVFVHNDTEDYVPRFLYAPKGEEDTLRTIVLERHDGWQTEGTGQNQLLYQKWTHVYPGLVAEDLEEIRRTLSSLDTADSNWKRRTRKALKIAAPVRYAITIVTLGKGEIAVQITKFAIQTVVESGTIDALLTSKFDSWTEVVNEKEGVAFYLPHEPKPLGAVAVLVNQETNGWLRGQAKGVPGMPLSISGSMELNLSDKEVLTGANGMAFFARVQPGKQTLTVKGRGIFPVVKPSGSKGTAGLDYVAGEAAIIHYEGPITKIVDVKPGRIASVEVTLKPRLLSEELEGAVFAWRQTGGTRIWTEQDVPKPDGGVYKITVPGSRLQQGQVDFMVAVRSEGKEFRSSLLRASIGPAGMYSEPTWWLERAANELAGIEGEKTETYYAELVRACLLAKRLDEAKAVAESIKHRYGGKSRSLEVYRDIADYLVRDGQLSAAASIVKRMPTGHCTQRALVEILTAHGHLQEAMRVASGISHEEGSLVRKVESYCTIAEAQAVAGDKAGALANLETARRLTDKIDFSLFRGVGLESISKAYVQLGDLDAAKSAVQAMGVEDAKSGLKRMANARIVEALANRGEFAEAEKLAETITAQSEKSRAYKAIVAAKVQSGDVHGAMSVADKIGDKILRYWVYVQIIETIADSGDIAGAAKLAADVGPGSKFFGKTGFEVIVSALVNSRRFDMALQMAKKIEVTLSRLRSFLAILAALAEQERFQEAEHVLSLIEETTRAAILRSRGDRQYVPHSWVTRNRYTALRILSQRRAEAHAFREAYALAHKIPHGSTERDTAMRVVAREQMKAGESSSLLVAVQGLQRPLDRVMMYIGGAEGLISSRTNGTPDKAHGQKAGKAGTR